MNDKTFMLLNWIENNIHPKKLTNSLLTVADLQSLKEDFTAEVKTLHSYFIAMLGRSRKKAKSSVLQLIIASDTIHNYLNTQLRSRKENLFTDEIRKYYRQTLIILESLLEDCEKFDKSILSNLNLTNYSISDIRMRLSKQLCIFRCKIADSHIDSELRELLLSGLRSLIGRKQINRLDTEYAFDILHELNSLEQLSTYDIENLLYQYDFNTPALFNYCAKSCNKSMLHTSSLHEQLEILIGLEDRINGLPARTKYRWLMEDESIRKQLRMFYKEKKSYVHQRIRLRRAELRDRKLADPTRQILINLSVAQFGLFIRLFIEKGLLMKDNVGGTFAFFARHFHTPKTLFISAESLQKKSTDVEFATAKKLKGYLISMLNWLNEHYNTSNEGNS